MPIDIDNLRLENDRRLVSAMLGLLLVSNVWFTWVDFALYPEDRARLGVRLLTRAISILVPIVSLVLVRRAVTPAAYARVVLATSMALALLLLAFNVQRPSGGILPMRTPLMFLIVLYGALPNTFYRQIAAPLTLTTGAVLLRVFWLNDSSSGDLPSDILILLLVNLAGVAMVYRRRVLERQVSASWWREHLARADAEKALKELTTLGGIIRICSYCRKIHNEEGAWQQIEAYVRDHSHAEFSHGICPDCVAEQFPPEKTRA